MAGALLLVWPAFVSGYPLLFSDTGGLIEMSLEPTMGWDKPWIYGPFVHLFHWRWSLWPTVLAQGLIVSDLVWRTTRASASYLQKDGATVRSHLLLCLLLAFGTSAPWFTALLMPDVFTSVAVLCLFLLGWGRLSTWVVLIGAIAIAAHLAHLVMAAACIATIGLLRRQWPWRPALPLLGALSLLLLTNFVGYGRLTISPHGSVFALARLIGDGPGHRYIDRVCPEAGLNLCAWRGRLATSSDDFLWAPYGPLWDRALWGEAFGPVALAPEAARLVPAIIAAEPGAVALAALRNTWAQLQRFQIGDTLGPDWLDDAVLPKLQVYFPAAETARYRASRQVQGQLAPLGDSFRPLHLAVLAIGLAGTILIALARPGPALPGLAVLVLVALMANAAVSGALSAPHDRYQARLVWLLLLPPFYAASRRATSAGAIRTSAS